MAQDRLKTLLQFYEEDPHDAFTQFALASEFLKLGDAAKALAFFERLVAERPDYVGTYYHLGKLYEGLGRKEDALVLYRKGVGVAQAQQDFHARAELQDALLAAQGIGFEDDEAFD